MNTCKTCKHWCNRQRELNYWETTGFCTNPALQFTIKDGRRAGVIDRENEKNRSNVTGNPSHDFETGALGSIKPSRYSLATTDDFGCVLHEKK